jgi:hypothetical protein
MTSTSNKRKRESADAGDTTRVGNNKRPSQGGATTNGSSHEPSTYSAVAAHDTQHSSAEEMSAVNQQLLQEHNMSLQSNGGRSVDATISTAKAASGLASSMGGLPVNEMSFASTASGGEGVSFGPGSQHNYPDPNMEMNPYHTPGSTAAQVQAARDATNMHHKPPVGSPEWHAQRKSSHKEGLLSIKRLLARLTDNSRTPSPRNHQRRHQRTGQNRPELRKEQGADSAANSHLHPRTSRRRTTNHEELGLREDDT